MHKNLSLEEFESYYDFGGIETAAKVVVMPKMATWIRASAFFYKRDKAEVIAIETEFEKWQLKKHDVGHGIALHSYSAIERVLTFSGEINTLKVCNFGPSQDNSALSFQYELDFATVPSDNQNNRCKLLMFPIFVGCTAKRRVAINGTIEVHVKGKDRGESRGVADYQIRLSPKRSKPKLSKAS